MNVKQLRDESERLRLDAAAKRKLAGQRIYNAEDYEKVNDTEKAKVERTEADKLNEEADVAERQADEHDQGAALQEARAIEIERRQAALESAHKQEMETLEREKTQIRGSAGLFS
jgi:hypothetical protein